MHYHNYADEQKELSNSEKARRWISIALFTKTELLEAVKEVMCNPTVLVLYNKQTAFFWKDKEQILKGF